MTAVTLTAGQQSAADAFFSFLMGTHTYFNISGTAGTGKTFLMAYLANQVMKNYYDACKLLNIKPEYHTVHFTATTNKAAEVLEQALSKPVQTLHSFMALTVRDDFKTGKSFITKTNSWTQHKQIILFIDECSMIDRQLYKLIKETYINCKIVYVGDHAQMAPVGETISEIYADIAPENFAVLTEPVRNAGSPALVQLCAQLRETVETGVFQPIMAVPGVIEYLPHSALEDKLRESFLDLDPACRALCYTNDRVHGYNEFIRTDVRNQPAEPIVGEILVVAQTSTASRGMTLNVERELVLKEVGPIEIDDRYDDIFPDGAPIEYRTVACHIVNRPTEVFKLRLAVQQERVNYAKKHFAKQKQWSEFYGLRDSYADLRDKSACTVYKSQGSTYDFVFVDLDNIGTSFDAGQVARMLFVAISRARHRVYLYGSLPHRYQGRNAA
jgi:exodeoxyribonuclease-5